MSSWKWTIEKWVANTFIGISGLWHSHAAYCCKDLAIALNLQYVPDNYILRSLVYCYSESSRSSLGIVRSAYKNRFTEGEEKLKFDKEGKRWGSSKYSIIDNNINFNICDFFLVYSIIKLQTNFLFYSVREFFLSFEFLKYSLKIPLIISTMWIEIIISWSVYSINNAQNWKLHSFHMVLNFCWLQIKHGIPPPSLYFPPPPSTSILSLCDLRFPCNASNIYWINVNDFKS